MQFVGKIRKIRGNFNRHDVIEKESIYITSSINSLLDKFQTSQKGLSPAEASNRLEKYGYNQPAEEKKQHVVVQFLAGFTNPLVLILLGIAAFWIFIGELVSAGIVMAMALMSVVIGFVQEYRAGMEAEKLLEMVNITAEVIRDGQVQKIKTTEIVPGDIIELSAGSMVPADLRIISSNDLFINESSLTGESFPVEKFADPTQSSDKEISALNCIAFMGSSVVSGTGQSLVIQTGQATQFGKLAAELENETGETSFDKGIKKFTWLMIRIIFCLTVFIFVTITVYKHQPIDQAIIFALAVAVGLAPEMLSMLVAINLSKGARDMAKKKVIVKRLNSIQNFGAMNVLCTDKTGTLTMDNIVLMKHCNTLGEEDDDVLRHAYLNSYYQTGLTNLMDEAVLKHGKLVVKKYKKVDEIPFDFARRIMSVVVDMDKHHRLVAKGAPEEIFKRSSLYEVGGKIFPLGITELDKLHKKYNELSADGFRVLAIAYRDESIDKKNYSKNDEKDLVFKGFIGFLDPPKPSAAEAIKKLEKMGISLKILSGDNELVTKKICSEVNIDVTGMVTGEEIERISDKELQNLVKNTNVFARLVPIQKERVIKALRRGGNVVGFLGDGINDAAALKAADVGISVNNAVDIAKETADIILLEKNLMVLQDCVIDGRKTFGNIVKYIKMGASSNFGNMFSMTGASLFLPFLPMQPLQIILNNFLYDVSQVTIPTDEVDKEYVMQPRPWDVNFIKKFLYIIGPLSSIFDFMTYGIMWFVFGARDPAHQAIFQTGWFIESLCTQTLIIHVIRTSKVPFLESRPSKYLILSSFSIVAIGIILPFTKLGEWFRFVHLPGLFFLFLLAMVIAYLLLVQFVKKWFIKKYGYQ